MSTRRVPTRDEAEWFRREGWLAIPDFWSRSEVLAMRRELDRLAGEGLRRNVATEGD